MYTVRRTLYKDTPEMMTPSLHGEVYKTTPEMRTPPLIRTLEAVQKGVQAV